jgi:hypothetical protein
MEYSFSFDCIAFTEVLTGRHAIWFNKYFGKFAREFNNFLPSTFCMIMGDIRNPRNDQEPQYHSANLFLDADTNQFWIIEPQSDELYILSNKSHPKIVIC